MAPLVEVTVVSDDGPGIGRDENDAGVGVLFERSGTSRHPPSGILLPIADVNLRN